FFSSRRRHTRSYGDWSSDVCSSDLLLTQTRRHTYLVSLLGVRHVALAVNKLDLIDYSEARFRLVETEYRAFARQLGIQDVTSIQIGRASCREREERWDVGGAGKKKE